jgi:phosphoribosyl 1,2-cyclic phosphodiesterase
MFKIIHKETFGMAFVNKSMSHLPRIQTKPVDGLIVRINGTLPHFSTIGEEKDSERAAELNQKEIKANTSCSVFSTPRSAYQAEETFHLLVDVGEGVLESLEKLSYDSDQNQTQELPQSKIPNAALITHSHDDHVGDLPKLVDKANSLMRKITIYCTKGCHEQITRKFPNLKKSDYLDFSLLEPNEDVKIGPLNVVPILANHGDESSIGSVIYVIKFQEKKIIMGWDFLSLINADENLMWNPDLLVLGTQTYNPHPETGMISVSESYFLLRTWNVKECYLVHYSGLNDFDEKKNQWFKGPVKAMTSNDLQKVIDSHLMLSGDGGRFRITVGKEGIVWKPTTRFVDPLEEPNKSIGNVIEIEGLEKYTFKLEKDANKLRVIIEDKINLHTMQFDRPHRDKENDAVVRGEGEQGMFSRGPALRMELVQSELIDTPSFLKIRAYKGKILKGSTDVFRDDIKISNTNATRIKKYFLENFPIKK